MERFGMNEVRVAVTALFFVNGMAAATWFVRIPAVKGDLGLSAGQLSLALLCVAFGSILTMFAAGRLVDRFGASRNLIAGVPLLCLGLTLIAFAPSLVALCGAGLVFGVGNGLLNVAQNSRASEIEGEYGRPIMPSFHASFSLGGFAAAALGGIVAVAGVGASAHLPATALALLVFAAAFFPLLARDAASGDAKNDARRDEEGGSGEGRFPLPAPAVVLLGIVGFCVLFGEGAMADWSAVYLQELGATEAVAAAGYAMFSLAMAAGRLSGNKLAEVFGSVAMVRLGGTLGAVGLSVALLPGHPMLALIGFGIVGLGFSTIFPLALSAAGAAGRASAIAFVSAGGYGGLLLGPPIIGFLAEVSALRLALASVIFLSLCVAAVAGVVGGKEGSRRGSAEPSFHEAG